MAKKYWVCIIGPVDEKELPSGADAPPRCAAENAIIKMIGKQPKCWSGWGCKQNTFEKIMDAWNKS